MPSPLVSYQGVFGIIIQGGIKEKGREARENFSLGEDTTDNLYTFDGNSDSFSDGVWDDTAWFYGLKMILDLDQN